MREREPFLTEDLGELDEQLLSKAEAVVSMREVYEGRNDADVIAMRHDVDNLIEPAVALAQWEAERGYRSTYYILHSAPYWNQDGLRAALEQITGLGHEIGIHANAIAEGLRTDYDPHILLAMAIGRLQGWGFDVQGVAGHGDPLCYGENGVEFANDEQFVECARPEQGNAVRTITRGSRTLTLAPLPLADFGLTYEARRQTGPFYLSDSGGVWQHAGIEGAKAFEQVVNEFPAKSQLQILQHPCWWRKAFDLTRTLEAVA